ncbi:MAG: hypothetical protein ACOVQ2_10275, partial [Flavobacterium sp.]
NAILHGVSNIKIPGKINIDFSVLENQLKITIQDNGIGYENSKNQKANSVLQHQSMAMGIIQKRIETIGGTFKISQTQLDETYPGTQIILQLNYLK